MESIHSHTPRHTSNKQQQNNLYFFLHFFHSLSMSLIWYSICKLIPNKHSFFFSLRWCIEIWKRRKIKLNRRRNGRRSWNFLRRTRIESSKGCRMPCWWHRKRREKLMIIIIKFELVSHTGQNWLFANWTLGKFNGKSFIFSVT